MNEIKNYRKKNTLSYSFGSFPTFELIKNKPEAVETVLLHSDANTEITVKLERECYPFMLQGEYQLGTFEHPVNLPYSLIFGNESSGLEESFLEVGKSVYIAHNRSIDSLNLSLATGIGIYEFCKSVSSI